MGRRSYAPFPPELLVESEGDSQVMKPGRSYTIGRDPLSDIVCTDPRVSWQHAVLRPGEHSWVLEDTGSTNGTYADGQRARLVGPVPVGPGSVLRFANPDDGPQARLSGAPSQPERAVPASAETPSAAGAFRQPTAIRPLPVRTLKIGRALGNDLVVDDLVVSRAHAELRTLPGGGYEIVDMGSHNGTYLNGQRTQRSQVRPGDIIGVGHSAFRLVGDELQEFVDTGEVSLTVQELTVAVDGGRRALLDHVSFPVGEKCLLAVVGPSGAGKSTLLGALTGLRPADHGTVLYDGRDLYRNYAELRQRIGLVPQEDILHTQLSARRALEYAAELRFPGDTGKTERLTRVTEVVADLGLRARVDQPISSLSGGQRKRVSVALELLTKPSLLFLDEPTSGLDPGMDRSVMHMLRALADDGRTVIVVTHSVLSLDVCDRLLVLAPGGRIAYYGPPREALPFFGFAQWPEAFEAFESDTRRDWAAQYRASPLRREYISDAMEVCRPAASPARAIAAPRKPQSWGSQLRTLVRRYTAVLSVDRTFLVVMVVLPFVMGTMARALAGGRLTPTTAMNALLILCVGGVLTGAANAVRELIKERVIYQRERAVGLSRSAYLFSKIVVLGAVTVVQAVVLTMVGLVGVTLGVKGGAAGLPPLAELTVTVALLSFTAMMFGLLISALVRREEVTMPLLVMVTIVQVVFCGALLTLHGVPGLDQFSWLVPARWALGAMAGTVDLHRIVPGALTADPLFRHSPGTWALDVTMLVVLSAAAGFVVRALLRGREPAAMRG
ncbi:FHA domain-containing protein [Streptomyces sp. RPT161]|uniref:FHA domain-containing protein n=1 Tax=Streptomyces sp. RPT161 TaxID=3015993 RepID=UPI0022B85A1B|nr:FHA domain-containing protein [Streptomyces sp. RPT161]